MATGDVNGDHVPDVVTLSPLDSNLFVMGNGDGAFRNAMIYGAGAHATALAVWDLNGERKPDLVFADDLFREATALFA